MRIFGGKSVMVEPSCAPASAEMVSAETKAAGRFSPPGGSLVRSCGFLKRETQHELHDARARKRIGVGAETACRIYGRECVRGVESDRIRNVEHFPAKRQILPLRKFPRLPERHVNAKVTGSAEVIAVAGFSRERETPSAVYEVRSRRRCTSRAILARESEGAHVTRAIREGAGLGPCTHKHSIPGQLPVGGEVKAIADSERDPARPPC